MDNAKITMMEIATDLMPSLSRLSLFQLYKNGKMATIGKNDMMQTIEQIPLIMLSGLELLQVFSICSIKFLQN